MLQNGNLQTLGLEYKGPDLNAKGNEIAIETLEIVFESMQRVK